MQVVGRLGQDLNACVLDFSGLFGRPLQCPSLLHHDGTMPFDRLIQCACMKSAINGEA